MPQEPFVNLPYMDPGVPLTTPEQVRAYASEYFNTLEELSVGRGTKAFKADPSGVWLGGNLFSEAPFRVDMLGNAVVNSILINGLGGDIIAGAINGDGNFINELISTSLNTQSKAILGEFVFSGSGALAIATDVNNGTWISPTGVLAKKAGATTFTLENDGDATFGGTLVAASGTFGTITAGTISGVTISGSTVKATGGAGVDVWLNSSNGKVEFYYSSSVQGYLSCDTSGNVILDGDNSVFIRADGVGDAIGITAGSYVLITAPYVTVTADLNVDDDIFITGDTNINGNLYIAGTSGISYTSYGFITSIRANGGNLEAKYREITTKKGVITNISAESGWNNMGPY